MTTVSYKELVETNLGQFYEYVGSDAQRWAQAFMEIVVDRNIEIDEGLMIAWFANAIESSYDYRTRQKQNEPHPFP